MVGNYRDQCRAIKTRDDGGGGHGDTVVRVQLLPTSDHTRGWRKMIRANIYVINMQSWRGNMTTVCLFIVIIY